VADASSSNTGPSSATKVGIGVGVGIGVPVVVGLLAGMSWLLWQRRNLQRRRFREGGEIWTATGPSPPTFTTWLGPVKTLRRSASCDVSLTELLCRTPRVSRPEFILHDSQR
jgi:hypothetical protein